MVIKEADDRSGDIADLKSLLDEKHLTDFQKELIREQLWNLEKGAWGEKKAAYFLNFHFKKYKRTILLHDLRLVLSNGDVAQIDHIIIDHFMDIYVLESKTWDRLQVDELGYCTTGRKRVSGTESPLEQCKRHSDVLTRVFRLDEELIKLAPRFQTACRVLVAPSCHLDAPHHRDSYLKADAFHTTWFQEVQDGTFNLKNIRSVSRWSKTETLMKIGERLLELHNPAKTNWREKFGVSPATELKPKLPQVVVTHIPDLAEHVPRWGSDWFVLSAKPGEKAKRALRDAGYRASQEKGEWVWRLRG